MTVPDSWSLDALLEAFEQHQRRTRGLRDLTLHGYARLVRDLIREALGDEDPATTHLYIEADLAMKEASLRRIADPAPAPLRFRARDRLLAFLDTL